MNYILFDGDVRNALLPFTYTKPVADIRIGILTIREKTIIEIIAIKRLLVMAAKIIAIDTSNADKGA